MISIDVEKCIGCGQCVKDCFPSDIEIIDGKAKVNNVTCMKCGHCIAVCPKDAVSIADYDMNEVANYNKDEFSIDSDNLLNFIKFRRTVRQFKNKEVEKEKILKIIEAGRFTQTGSNSQNVSYTVVRENVEELKELTFKSLKSMGEELLEKLDPNDVRFRRYANMWINMHKEYKEDPKNDKLFFNAPAIIVVTSDSDVNGALASSNMELMTNAIGLGTFFSGFFVMAAQGNKEIRELLGLDESKKIVTCMVIGYPDVKYFRTVPRRKADISWK
jgi:nitroreductase/Pyruvate/2-oxoacid:ferredoxin oxidoreductase delta subunit